MAKQKKPDVEGLRAAYRAEVAGERRREAERNRGSAVSDERLHESVGARLEISEDRAFDPSFGSLGESDKNTQEVVSKPRKKSQAEAMSAPQPVGRPLDAYWASYGSPVHRAAARMGEIEPERVIGEDDRVQIEQTENYPWRCICALSMTTQTGQSYIGSGWLVSPRLLVTAGHCVYGHEEGGWMRSIEVIPGLNGTERPFGAVWAQSMRSVRGWTRERKPEFDYGAILLPDTEEGRLGERLGWLGYANREDDYIEGRTLNISGYPGDKDPYGFQWWHAQGIESVGEKTLHYEIDTFGGQSGSPVWERTSEGYRYGLGIHNYGMASGNQATRVTSSVFQNISNWVAEVP